ncbi:unnamed protein product, partial [Mesorhabditis belari]|uniref:Uncharacterized protein n=1 Tax=Mesorhabditis belari TaxID=2138241 RepID=A0AAF3FHV2_9BILA
MASICGSFTIHSTLVVLFTPPEASMKPTIDVVVSHQLMMSVLIWESTMAGGLAEVVEERVPTFVNFPQRQMDKCPSGWQYYDQTDSCYYARADYEKKIDMSYDGSCSGSFPFKAGSVLTGGVFDGAVLKYWMDGSSTNYTHFCTTNPDGPNTSVLLRSLPPNCDTGCGGGLWMAGYEAIDTNQVYPAYVCKSSPLC